MTIKDEMSSSQVSMLLNTEIDKYTNKIECVPLFHSILACSYSVKRAHLVDASVSNFN